ncbi:MAG: nucleotidyltransferase domain-containing protein [Candidatus Shapirobacteria bacterium]|jgi:predicted nucleotidyltransferase|nr:nucleotidyltransferase domain-containing protein [Candidatus Shapirobacteria bacterium]
MNIFNSIRETIKYSQKYKGQLTKNQLFYRLIGNKVYTREEFLKAISIVNYQIIKIKRKNKELEKKIEKAENLAKLIKENFKDILFLGITGSVAAGYPKKNDDIDLIIITKRDKLWINRLKLRIFIKKNKIPHRKFNKKEKKDDFCFNLWLDEKSIQIKEKQNLKNAIDLILIRPLINKNETYERFIRTNDWAKKYVATGYSLKPTLPSLEKGGLKNSIFLDRVVNWLVFWPQFFYMKNRIKNEEIGLHKAFFHH